MESPNPVRLMTSFCRSISTATSLVSESPRWSGILLAKTGVGLPPVMSRGFGAPVSFQSRIPNVDDSTVNSMYRPLTTKVLPTLLAPTTVF